MNLPRHGARQITGFDKIGEGIDFSRRLFKDVPVESRYVRTNLAIDCETFEQTHRTDLQDRYDIVLYLGVYQHLKRHMPAEELLDFVRYLANKARSWFVVRTNHMEEIHELILSCGFHLEKADSRRGLLHIYKRIGSEDQNDL